MPDIHRPSVFTWVTWITGLLSGDRQCLWAAWYKSNFQYAKREESPEAQARLLKWKGEHGDMVRRREVELRADGWRVYVEGQNKFFVRGRTATLAGGPDLVATRDAQPAPDVARAFALTGDVGSPSLTGHAKEALVEDEKTGTRRDSDASQVIIYMSFLKQTHDAVKGRVLSGRVNYIDGVRDIPADAADAAALARIGALVQMCGAPDPPPRTPSFGECQWCDILCCPDRQTVETAVVATEAF